VTNYGTSNYDIGKYSRENDSINEEDGEDQDQDDVQKYLDT
jgi:hypothetical protein